MKIRVQGLNANLTPSIREWAVRRITSALNHLSARVRSVALRLRDENGPKGGRDKRCVAEARLVQGGTVLVEARDEDLYAAISRVSDRLSRRVGGEVSRARRLHRSRLTP